MIRIFLSLCIFRNAAAFKFLPEPLTITSSSFSTALQRERMGSFVYFVAPAHDLSCNCNNDVEVAMNSLTNFDSSYSTQACKVESSMSDILKGIIPSVLFDIKSFRDDVTNMILATASLSRPSETMACRLALINGVRCPKWHEDYVKIRLLKTYHGIGTEWVDPQDLGVRAMNHLRSTMDWDLDVKDRAKVRRLHVNDVLIISGREREDSSIVPVLHRSPSTKETDKRLLFTVTIS